MPQLKGLVYELTWERDFWGYPPSKAPRAEDGKGRANTWIHIPVTRKTGITTYPADGGHRLRPIEDVEIGPPACGYNNQWTLKTQEEIDDALNHEQGHYDLTALLARDYFVDMMLLQQEVFPDSDLAVRAVRAVEAETVDMDRTVSNAYDTARIRDKTNRGRQAQRIWNHAIYHAFNNVRASGTAPNGTPHKARLVVVLRWMKLLK